MSFELRPDKVVSQCNVDASNTLRDDFADQLPALKRQSEPPSDGDARGAYYTNLRAKALIGDVEKLPAGTDISTEGAFLKMMFTTEYLENGANPLDDEKGIYALASKFGAGIHAQAYITDNCFNKDFPYSLNIVWNGKKEEFPFA